MDARERKILAMALPEGGGEIPPRPRGGVEGSADTSPEGLDGSDDCRSTLLCRNHRGRLRNFVAPEEEVVLPGREHHEGL